LPDVIVPERSDPAGADGDAGLGEGDARVVAEGTALVASDDGAELWGCSDVDWLPHPTATNAIAINSGAISRGWLRIVIFRLSAFGWDGNAERKTMSLSAHRDDDRMEEAPRPRKRGGASLEPRVTKTADAGGPLLGYL
jgi:hypothetical protein